MDKTASVSYASANTAYGVLETSGIANICQNIMHLFHIKRSLYMNE